MVAVKRTRPLAWLTLAAGLGLLVLFGARGVAQPPLYDGVVVEDPYRYLDPAAGGPGHPSSVSDTLAPDAGVSPSIYSGTLENPPQAQLIIDRDALELPAGTTAIKVAIEPIVPPAAPVASGLSLGGNVYRFTITNQAGTALTLRSGKTATVVLRAPNGVTSGILARFADGKWSPLATQNAGLPDMFAANPPSLGTYVVTIGAAASSSALPGSSGLASTPVASQPSSGSGSGGPSAPIWIAIGLLAAALLLGIWYLRDVARGSPPSGPR
jgi:hypothetical protein